MFERLKAPKNLEPLLLGLAVAGYGLRVFLWWVSKGSNDILTWEIFALTLKSWGLGGTYQVQPLFNHPPLMGLFSLQALEFATGSELTFAQVFKLPSLLAELCTGLLLYLAFRARGQRLLGLVAFAAYGLSINCILISGYHGNTDAIYFCLAFAAAYLLEARGAPFLAGLALGAAINVKIIPVLLGLPLLSRCADWRAARRFVAGASLGGVPFLAAFLSFDSPAKESFVRNIFMYRSNLEYWGVELGVRWLYRWTHDTLPSVAVAVRSFGNWYSMMGGKVLIVASAALAGWHLFKRRRQGAMSTEAHAIYLDAYQLSALAFALFLLFGSGFGVQYVGCVVAPLLACTIWGGSVFAVTSGVFIGSVYEVFVIQWSPIYSEHRMIPGWLSPLANIAWLSLAIACVKILIDAKQAQGERFSQPPEAPPRPASGSVALRH